MNVVVSCVTVVVGVGDGKVPVPDAELLEGVCKVEFRFVDFACPVVDATCAWPGAKAAVGKGARFSSCV